MTVEQTTRRKMRAEQSRARMRTRGIKTLAELKLIAAALGVRPDQLDYRTGKVVRP